MNINYTEYVIDNCSSVINKELYRIDSFKRHNDYFYNNDKFGIIYDYLGALITHIGIDKSNGRKKIYMSLYDFNLKKNLKIINTLKNIIGIKKIYRIEKDFLKFDCVGIDFFPNGIVKLKIYEIVDSKDYSGLPSFCEYDNVKEIGFLKDFDGRKKKFFRFINFIDINKFDNLFTVSNSTKNYNIKGKVKYFCIENKKQEIYFI